MKRAIGQVGLVALLALAGCGGASHPTVKKAEEELHTLCPHGVLIAPHRDECIGTSHSPGTLGAGRIKLLEAEITRLCIKASVEEATNAACGLHGARGPIGG
jgi:hypothetical protein